MRRNRGLLALLGAVLLLGAVADALPSGSHGGAVVFSRADTAGRYSLWTFSPGSGALRRVTRSCGWDWFPAWSPDRGRIAFVRGCGKFEPGGFSLDLYTVRVDGTRLRRLVQSRTNEEWPSWSPDGSRIAFVSGEPQWTKPGQRGDAAAELWVVGSDGGGLTRLTHNAVRDGGPAWSPDGKWIAFSRAVRGHNGIWLIGPDGRHAHPLDLPGGEPAWSPDGRKLAFAHTRTGVARETVDLYVANADGTGMRRLTHERVGVVSHHPSWSPDGRSIVYTTNRGGKSVNLWIVGADGRNARRLTHSPIEDADPDWAGAIMTA
jgi:TolB protein